MWKFHRLEACSSANLATEIFVHPHEMLSQIDYETTNDTVIYVNAWNFEPTNFIGQ